MLPDGFDTIIKFTFSLHQNLLIKRYRHGKGNSLFQLRVNRYTSCYQIVTLFQEPIYIISQAVFQKEIQPDPPLFFQHLNNLQLKSLHSIPVYEVHDTVIVGYRVQFSRFQNLLKISLNSRSQSLAE